MRRGADGFLLMKQDLRSGEQVALMFSGKLSVKIGFSSTFIGLFMDSVLRRVHFVYSIMAHGEREKYGVSRYTHWLVVAIANSSRYRVTDSDPSRFLNPAMKCSRSTLQPVAIAVKTRVLV